MDLIAICVGFKGPKADLIDICEGFKGPKVDWKEEHAKHSENPHTILLYIYI